MVKFLVILVNALALYLFWAHIFPKLIERSTDDTSVCDFFILFIVFLFDLGLILARLGVFVL